MKFGISVYGADQLVPEEKRTVANIVQAAARAGFDGIDLGYYWSKNKKAEMKEVKKVADAEGIQLANYITGNNFGNIIAEGDKKKLQAEIQSVKTAIDDAAYFGNKVLRIFAGGAHLPSIKGKSPWQLYSKKILDCFITCTEYARKNNVILALEDHGGLSKNSKEMLYYINAVNSPYFKANCDIGNFWDNGGELPIDGVTAVADKTVMVHVKDYTIINNKFVSVPVGEGIIDFVTCFRILADAGYQDWLTLEYECQIGDPRQGIRTSLVTMRNAAVGCF